MTEESRTVFLICKFYQNTLNCIICCAAEVCNLECGPHGVCESGACVCEPGWRGPRCDVQNCDPRCSEHGMCSNGTCLCTNGWNGKHCTLEGKFRNTNRQKWRSVLVYKCLVTSDVDPEWFLPDPNPATKFQSSGSGSSPHYLRIFGNY